jgi:hypothetical protein
MLLDDILVLVTVSEIIPGMPMPFAELIKSLRLKNYGQANNRIIDDESINRLSPIKNGKQCTPAPQAAKEWDDM